MTLVGKSIVGLCVGIAELAALHSAGIWSLKQYLKPIYASVEHRLAVEGAAREIGIRIRAVQNAVPVSTRLPGMP